MENENNIIEYLQGKLSEEQKAAFERRLKMDENFYREYLVQKQMHSYLLERNDREKYTAVLDKLGAKYFPSNGRQSKVSIKRIVLFVLIILLALFAAWYLLKPKSIDLYESHADHFALHLVLKNDENTIALNAENAFNNGDFNIAITALKQYLESNAIDTKAKLALGISYLETEKYDDANALFDEIRNGSSTLKDYGTWYKALYYVKISNYAEAMELLKSLPELDAQLYKRGQELLEDVEKVAARDSGQ